MKRTTSLFFVIATLLFVGKVQAATTLLLFRSDGTVLDVTDSAIVGSSIFINIDTTQKKIEMGVFDSANDEYASKIYFVAPIDGSPLITGSSYTDAVQYRTTVQPTASFRVKCDNIYWPINNPGWFKILEVEYTSPGEYNKLAIDFGTGDGTIGSWRHNSSIAPIPEPSTLTIAIIGIGLTLRRRR